MADSLQVTISVIVHATEDASRFLNAFEGMGIAGDEFSVASASGHYDNPITILNAELRKERAQEFVGILRDRISPAQKDILESQMAERIEGSKIHLRIGKQGFLGGRMDFEESDAIRIRIKAPIYNRQDAASTFSKILFE